MKRLCYLLLLFLPCSLSAQNLNFSGRVLADADSDPLIGVTVTLTALGDSSLRTGTVSDYNGAFALTGLMPGRYRLHASYLGYAPYTRDLDLKQDTDFGTLRMKVSTNVLKDVVIVAQQIQMTQRGDTTSFNAGAFKTNPDASAEDLINKMPGLTTSGGTLKANGEDVKKVLVDGKPFFGDDPNAAIKNLPAEVIDRIEVFDKLSDQAQLTGFNDGNEQRTLNIVTKPGKNKGQFGRVTAGAGTDFNQDRMLYQAGGNINFFEGDRRISLIGMSNNINQQNFSTDDLLGMSGGSRGGGRRGGASGNFLVGQQAGITTTHAAGINYSDEWAKNLSVSGSYFFNTTKNENQTGLQRNYFSGPGTSQLYNEESRNLSHNTNHRANLRLEYEPDSNNKVIFTPRLSFQQYDNERQLLGQTRLPDSSLLSSTNNQNKSQNQGLNGGADLTYRHKFDKKGRSASVNLSAATNNREGDGATRSENFYQQTDSAYTDFLDQRYDQNNRSQNYSANLTYTEPLSRQSQLMVNYNPSLSVRNSDKESFDLLTGALDPQLSNTYENTYTTQKGGLNYRYNKDRIRVSVGLNYQHALLQGERTYPNSYLIERNFSNLLPSASFNYRWDKNRNLRLNYRSSTNAPDISQLHDVLDISNPLLIRTGNAALSQDYTHTLWLRYSVTDPKKNKSFFVNLYGSYVNNYIGTETIYPTTLISLGENISMAPGSQLSRPVNLNGYVTARSFVTYGLPIQKLKSNLNVNAGINYNRLPGQIRYAGSYDELFSGGATIANLAHQWSFNAGLVLSSNISEKVDFTLSHTSYYNTVRNTSQQNADNNYYSENTSLSMNLLFGDRLKFQTSGVHTLYAGLSQGYNQSYLLWNAGLGYKMLHDKSLELSVNAYDILNQNKSIDRNVTDSYVEDRYTQVLQRYFMLNLTYTLRRFGGK